MKNAQSGFTLLEILLSISVIAVLAGTTISVYQSFQLKNDLDIAANTIVQTAHRAQLLSQAVDGDSTWGINIRSGNSITLFKGSNFNTRDTDFDESFDLPSGLTSSGVQTIVFSKLDGDPSTTGTIQLRTSTNESRVLTINSKGMINY